MPYPRLSSAQHSHRVFPAPVTGYAINGRWEVVEPVGVNVVNLVSNPSVEVNTTGYSAQGSATIARDSADQRRGVYSLKVTPTSAQLDGVFYATVTLVGQSTYTFSLDLKGAGGVKYRFYVASTVNNAISPVVSVKATGRWQRVSVTFREPNTAGLFIARRLYIVKDYSASTAPFRVDGLSVVALPYPVTYFDGDSVGFVVGRNDFYWNGTRHGSTSTMASFTRAGGKVTPFSKFGFAILAMLGLGMQPIVNLSTPQAFIGGGQYQRTVSQDRIFDLVGVLNGRTLQELQVKRRKLLDLFKPDATPSDSPLLLLYTPVDDCGVVVGETLEIPCVYENGLQGRTDNHYQENVALRFHSFMPFLGNATGERGAVLDYQEVFTGLVSARAILQKNSGGVWSVLGNKISDATDERVDFNGNILATEYNTVDNRLYVGGLFTLPHTRIAAYNFSTQTFESLGDPGGQVNSIAFLANGDVIAAVGAAGSSLVRQYSLASGTWSTLGTPTGGVVFVDNVLVGNDGIVYALGDFTAMNGVAALNVARYLTTGAWSPLGAGLASRGVSSVVGLQGYIYIGTLSSGVYQWTGSALSLIGSATSSTDDLAIGLDGRLYATGDWTTIGGVSANRVAAWNGIVWSPLGAGLSSGAEFFQRVNDGGFVAGGIFTTAGTLTNLAGSAFWNLSSWVSFDIFVSTASGGVYRLRYIPTTDSYYVVPTGGGSFVVTTGVVTTVLNTSTHDASPIVTLTGPGKVYQIENRTTGETLYFDLTLLTGEVATLDLTPGKVRFYSNFRPNLLGTILPGSDLATFHLAPGSNFISVFITGGVTSATALVMRWRVCHWALDAALDTP